MDNIQNAHIILMLISSDFIASEFCYSKEMGIAISRTKKKEVITIPIIVRPCDWFDLPFAKFQSIPRDNNPIADMDKNNRDKSYLEVVNEIKKVVKAIEEKQS